MRSIVLNIGDMMSKDNQLYGRISVYVPKHERNFLKICEKYAETEFPDYSYSSFVIMCIKSFVNSLNREDKKRFEELAWQLAKKEKPTTSDFVERFINKGV